MLRNWRFWIVMALLGALLGVGAGWVTMRVWANYHAGRLLSDDAEVQSKAIEYWGLWRRNDLGQRLRNSRVVMRAVDRRFDDATDESLKRFFYKFHFPFYLNSPDMPHMREALHELLGRRTSGPMEYRRDLGYVGLTHGFTINGMHDEVERYVLASIPQSDARLREYTLSSALGLQGRGAESIVAAMLDDPDPKLARRAWLAMAFIDPLGGYSGDWREAADGVAEAILYASVATSDRPELILEQVQSDPMQAARFAWLGPFLESLVAWREGDSAPRPTLIEDAAEHLRQEYLFEGVEVEPSQRSGLQRSAVWGDIAQIENGWAPAVLVFRRVFTEHPLPSGAMDTRQREFAGAMLRGWWAVYQNDYEFDESEKVFRRKTNKAPE